MGARGVFGSQIGQRLGRRLSARLRRVPVSAHHLLRLPKIRPNNTLARLPAFFAAKISSPKALFALPRAPQTAEIIRKGAIFLRKIVLPPIGTGAALYVLMQTKRMKLLSCEILHRLH